MTVKTLDKNAELLARGAYWKAVAEHADTSNTETVTAADLKDGDVITTLGNATFPFAFVITTTREIAHGGKSFGYHLTAAHGWFSTRPVKATETVTRIIVGA
jgi:hypothetical protein